MIKTLPQSNGAILGFEISGKVSLDEEKQWIKKFDEAIKQNDKLSVLVILDANASWGIQAGIEDLKWLITHMNRFHRFALVSDSNVWKWLVTIDSVFANMIGIGEKHFKLSDIDHAWQWVKA